MITGQELLKIRELQGLSQDEFARNINRTRELVNKMERGKCSISARTYKRIKDYLYSVNPALFSHDVNILGQPSQIASASSPSKSYFLERQELKKHATPAPEVSLVGIKAQAGYVRNFEQVDEYVDTLEKYSLPPGVNPTGAVWRYFEVDGDSMEPTLFGGDLILASMMPQEDWADVKNFSVYILLLEDQLLVKRVFKKNSSEWVLISDNDEAYPQKLLQVASIKQVWTFRRHIRSRIPQPKEFKIAV